jgi:hypothetical protein
LLLGLCRKGIWLKTLIQLANTYRRWLHHYWLFSLALIVGTGARLYALSQHSLLLDEAFVAVGARDILRNHTPMWDAISNAPFVWTLAHIVGLHGLDSIFFLRLPGAVLGCASILMVFLIARRMFGRDVASIAAFVFALHPFAVAFARVLFADRFQVFFILLGIIATDRFAVRNAERSKNIALQVLWIGVLWAMAFLMKYNALVPAAIWLITGVLSSRYSLGRAMICLLAITAGALLTLALWPYDAPIWLAAFLVKGGSYNVAMAATYFQSHLHLILFGVTEIVILGGLLLGLMLRNARGRSFAHASLFILLYMTCVIFLGRRFERYLLMVVPVAAILISALVFDGFRAARQTRDQIRRAVFLVMTLVVCGVYLYGMALEYTRYFSYLRNDVDHADIARTVLQAESSGKRAFWLMPEPIAAYYLGFSQHYSRAIRTGLDGEPAEQNYFEWVAVPYSEEWKSYSVLSVRDLSRNWGVSNILTSPKLFLDTVNRIVASHDNKEPIPTADYLTSDLVRQGDLLIMQSGLMDVQGEPVLEQIGAESTPPMLPRLPLERFRVIKAYRPGGISSNNDTTLDRLRAGAWILERR